MFSQRIFFAGFRLGGQPFQFFRYCRDMLRKLAAWPVAILACGCLWPASTSAQEVATPTVVDTHPHDTGAFTQGLLLHSGSFYESTGLVGQSTLREVNPGSGEVLRSIDVATPHFAEGLALVGERLIQLTWQTNTAFVYARDTFELLDTFEYTGEGWGLCFDGERLVMSDGSGSLFFRDPDSFELQGSVEVTRGGQPVTRLNELECVGRLVYANVWQTNDILRIDPESGEVLTRINAAALSAEQPAAADVLNGIAYDPDTQHFFITGKLWDTVYETSFEFSPGGDPEPTAPDSPDAGSDTTLPDDSEQPDASAAPDASPDGGVRASDATQDGISGDAAPDAEDEHEGPDGGARPGNDDEDDASDADGDHGCDCAVMPPDAQRSRGGLLWGVLALALISRRRPTRNKPQQPASTQPASAQPASIQRKSA